MLAHNPSDVKAAYYRYFIQLCFDGSHYNGWQMQRNAPSVQAEIDQALSTLLREQILTTGAGRTDTGVHARIFFAHFDAAKKLNEKQLHQLSYKTNQILPNDIAVQGIFSVPDNAHARFDAISRTYHYHITKQKDPFLIGKAWLLERHLDIKRMQDAAELLTACTDFSSFCKSGAQNTTNRCRIMHAQWTARDHLLVFEIKADRFLRNMVRALTGTMVEAGLGKVDTADFRRIIEAKDRRKAGYSVPGHGLYLTGIEYADPLRSLLASSTSS